MTLNFSPVAMTEFTDQVSGIPAVGAVLETKRTGKTTSGLLVQQATYNLSKAIFQFSPPTFELDNAVQAWKAKQAANLDGQVPETFSFETRVGASLSLLGYLEQSGAAGITSVIAASGTMRVMEPVLSRHRAQLAAQPVVFQVAAVDYDSASGQLVPDFASVTRVSRNLDLPLVVSNLVQPNDAYNTAVLASVIATQGSPAVHLYDGLRGTRQAVADADHKLVVPASRMPKVSSVLEAFKATNEALGTNLAPFEYAGSAEPSTVFVTLGAPQVLARTNKHGGEGVLNVRLYSPFLTSEFLAALPSSASRIVVVGDSNDLYKDVSAAVRLHFGFRGGPTVFSEPLSDFAAEETGPTVTVWDSDKASTAIAAARLATPLPDASVFTKFDNCVAGGAVASELRLRFANQFWDVAESDATFVNFDKVLQSVDVAAGTKHGGKLVIAASSDEDVAKSLPTPLKRSIAAKNLELYRLDYDMVASAATEGRTPVLAAQAAIWLLSGADVDATTSSVVHANSLDTELIAATVNVIVVTLKEKALQPVSKEVTKDWATAELSEKDQSAQYTQAAVATSFAPSTLAQPEAEDAEEETHIEEATGKTDVDLLGLKKHLVFGEAFNTRQKLRPDAGTRTVVSKVKLNQRVTPDDYDRHIFKLELDISGTGLQYGIGEALAVYAPNRAEDVTSFLHWFGVDPEEVHALPSQVEPGTRSYGTAYQISRDHLDLFGKVPKRFYEGLVTYVKDEEQRAKIEHLLSPAGVEELKRRTEVDFENYVDVLHEFSSAKPNFGQLAELVAPLKRREYSIASSQKMYPNEVHLLIVVVDWVNSKGEKRYGQCSKFLADLRHGDEVVVGVKPSVLKLPADPKTPIIMAGLGTGLAPFKAFLEEKVIQREQGHEIGEVYLFLGSRHQRQEYLYGELFEAYKAAGVLTHIGAAFSRDQPEKIYIQNRIQQAKPALADAFVAKKGNFYLCGPTWPVPDISAALTEIVLEGSAKTGAQVNEATLIEDLKDQERYVLEVY